MVFLLGLLTVVFWWLSGIGVILRIPYGLMLFIRVRDRWIGGKGRPVGPSFTASVKNDKNTYLDTVKRVVRERRLRVPS
jgi:hypothetical protein